MHQNGGVIVAKKSIVTDDMTHCIISGSPDVAIHHLIFGTSGRAKADEDGLIVPLDPTYHNMGNSAIAFVGTSGVQLGWLASQADILSEDWLIVG